MKFYGTKQDDVKVIVRWELRKVFLMFFGEWKIKVLQTWRTIFLYNFSKGGKMIPQVDSVSSYFPSSENKLNWNRNITINYIVSPLLRKEE